MADFTRGIGNHTMSGRAYCDTTPARSMIFVASVVLACLIALAEAFGVLRDDLATGLVSAVLAVAVVGISLDFRQGVFARFRRLLPPILLGVAFAPCFFMFVQLLPLPWFSNPVWTSTATALNNNSTTGFPTIDVGATLLSFCRYLAVLASAITMATAAFQRQLSENGLYSLVTIVGIVAAFHVVSEFFTGSRGIAFQTEVAFVVVVGFVLSFGAIVHTWEQLPRRRRRRELQRRPIAGLVVSTAALILCAISIFVQSDVTIIFAAVFGASVPFCILVIRRWFFGTWGKVGVAAVALMILLGSSAFFATYRDADQSNSSSMRRQIVAERILSDVPTLGSGAGSYNDLLPIYRDLDQKPAQDADSAATIVTVEMGHAFFWIFVLALMAGIIMLVKGALARGRDYSYAAAGAGVLAATAIMMFTSSGFPKLASSLIVSSAIGLAMAQRFSSNEDISSGSEREGDPLKTGPFRLGSSTFDHAAIRAVLIIVGLVLAAQAVWILLPEQYLSDTPPSLLDNSVAAEQGRLKEAASLAAVRGDFWARSALAGALLLEKNPSSASNPDPRDVHHDLMRALHYAPYRSDVWLKLTTLSDRYKWNQRQDLRAQIKMAYYTGPNETALILPRLKVALGLVGPAADIELEDMIGRDIRLILARLPALRPGLAEAYRTAGPSGRSLAERFIGQIDPNYLASLLPQ